jgi:endonuclease/exonuclease/phosphatase family metal-dependent hydrolase
VVRRLILAWLCITLAGPGRGAAHDVKVSTWNLNWFTLRSPEAARLPQDVRPRDAGDIARLRSYAEKLAADIVGYEEVDGPEAAAALFDPEEYTIATTRQNVAQRVGIAVRKPIRVRNAADYVPLDVDPDAFHPLRDGLDATLDWPDGATLRVLVIHLKTGCFTDDPEQSPRPSCALLSRQVPPLAAWIAARQAEAVPFMVLGDFNRVFDAPERVGGLLARAAPMLRATAGYENPCWDGGPFIDHIFLGGAARQWLRPGSLRVQLFTTSLRNGKARLSDHCPVSVVLAVPGGPP